MLKQIALLILCALFGVLGSKAITEYKRAAKAHSATQKHYPMKPLPFNIHIVSCKPVQWQESNTVKRAVEPAKATPQGMRYTNGTAYLVRVKDESGRVHELQSGESVTLDTMKNKIQYPDMGRGWQNL